MEVQKKSLIARQATTQANVNYQAAQMDLAASTGGL
jgi:hypothetical protein